MGIFHAKACGVGMGACAWETCDIPFGELKSERWDGPVPSGLSAYMHIGCGTVVGRARKYHGLGVRQSPGWNLCLRASS